ncbi:MAG TPA: RluA family pseudouridine synthase [Acholeplasma sp.]|nr:RluA family pseudouridine synthase [Acholeplasma sp.]
MKLTFIITEQFDNKRIRDFLNAYHVGKKTIYDYSLNKRLLLNGIPKHDMSLMNLGDKLEIVLEDNLTSIKPYNLNLDIVYEDDDLLVINKPEKLLIHSDGTGAFNLTDIVNYKYYQQGYRHQILPAHRIDYETSGLVVFAKHFMALSFLSKLFEEKHADKYYIGLVSKPLREPKGVIDIPLDYEKRLNKMVESSKGKRAVTEYEVIGDNKVLIKIITGRTHQIRAHFSIMGSPIVGDPLYGMQKDRLYLHSYKITFVHPRTKEKVTFEKYPNF